MYISAYSYHNLISYVYYMYRPNRTLYISIQKGSRDNVRVEVGIRAYIYSRYGKWVMLILCLEISIIQGMLIIQFISNRV